MSFRSNKNSVASIKADDSSIDLLRSQATSQLKKATLLKQSASTEEDMQIAESLLKTANLALAQLDALQARHNKLANKKSISPSKDKIKRRGNNKIKRNKQARPKTSRAKVRAKSISVALNQWNNDDSKSDLVGDAVKNWVNNPNDSSDDDDNKNKYRKNTRDDSTVRSYKSMLDNMELQEKNWLRKNQKNNSPMDKQSTVSAARAHLKILSHLRIDTEKLNKEVDKDEPSSPFRFSKMKKSPSADSDRILSDKEISERIKKIKATPNLPPHPRPTPPDLTKISETKLQILAIQNFIRELQYNHTGEFFFDTEKQKSILKVMQVGKEIETSCLPIKCLEAVILATYMTREIDGIVRFPLRFRSRVAGQGFWHIVLALKNQISGKFGAIGLSRRPTLDYKEMKYDNLSDLIEAYLDAYHDVGHRVRKITIGLPMGRLTYSHERVFWHFFLIPLKKGDWEAARPIIDTFGREIEKVEAGVRRDNHVSSRNFGIETVYDPNASQLFFLSKQDRDLRAQAARSLSRSIPMFPKNRSNAKKRSKSVGRALHRNNNITTRGAIGV